MGGPGQRLRALREGLGLTVRDVEAATAALAQAKQEMEFYIPISRISDIETKGVIPNAYRFYALSVVYKTEQSELMNWYGIRAADWSKDVTLFPPPRTTSISTSTEENGNVRLPAKLDPAFSLKETTDIGRMIRAWGVLPAKLLNEFVAKDYVYAYVGTEDLSMYPLVLPGSFMQIDPSQTKVEAGPWGSEYERPMYFVETRDGFLIGWCSLRGSTLSVQSHPLSGREVRSFKHPVEAEIIGRVVGVAMRLDWNQKRAAR